MSSFSNHGPVDFLMSVEPPSPFTLPFSPSSSETHSPSSTLSPSSSPPHPSSSSSYSPSSASSDSLDSPAALSPFLRRCREAGSSHARLLLASKIANVEDDDVKQSFIEQGGVSVLLGWLELSSVNTHHVIVQTLDALSILPLTSTTASYRAEQLQSKLRDLAKHSNESVSQAADELLNSLALKEEDDKGSDEEEVEEDSGEAGSKRGESKFHLIKIDKTTAEHHEHAVVGASKIELPSSDDHTEKQTVEFDSLLSPIMSPAAKAEADATAVNDDKQKQVDMAERMEVEEHKAKVEDDNEAAVKPRSKKQKRLSVRWVEDDKLEDVRLFFKDEVLKKEKKKAPAVDLQEDKSAIDWYTPPPITALPNQSQQAASIAPTSGDDRAGKRQASFPGVKSNGAEAASGQSGGVSVDLLSSLNSLASMLSSSTSASSPSSSAAVFSASSSSAPSSATASAATSSNLSALLSNLSSLSASTSSAPASVAYPAPSSGPAPSGGASRLLSLLSNTSALSGLAASLQAPSQTAPPQQPPQYLPHPAQHSYTPASATSAPLLPYPPQQSYAAPPPPSSTAAAAPPPSYRPPLLPPPVQTPYYAPPAAPLPPVGYPHSSQCSSFFTSLC